MATMAAPKEVEGLKCRVLPSDRALRHLPTLMVVPSNLVYQTYDTISNLFEGRVIPKLYYSSTQFASTEIGIAADTNDVSNFGKFMDGLMCAGDKIEVCLAAYALSDTVRPEM
jgi:hypothetical protein